VGQGGDVFVVGSLEEITLYVKKRNQRCCSKGRVGSKEANSSIGCLFSGNQGTEKTDSKSQVSPGLLGER